MIKLLEKSKLNELKAKNEAREIQEGMKLSTRVDGLRKLQAKTEEDFEKYKNATLSALGEEVKILERKKDVATANLKAVEAQLEATLSKTEQKALEDLRKKLSEKEKELKDRAFKVDLAWVDVMTTQKEANKLVVEQKKMEEDALRKLLAASGKETDAERRFREAQEREQKVAEDERQKNVEIGLKENVLKRKEQDILQTQVKLENERKELDIEKVQVADMRATLERALERIRKNNLL